MPRGRRQKVHTAWVHRRQTVDQSGQVGLPAAKADVGCDWEVAQREENVLCLYFGGVCMDVDTCPNSSKVGAFKVGVFYWA